MVNKLFEFMHELHPGVQDMACDTFLKIAHKCKRKFVTQQPGEGHAFVHDLVHQLPQIISDLEPHQVHAFYEATATLLSDRGGSGSNFANERGPLLTQLMAMPNDAWRRITADAQRDTSTLTRQDTVRDVGKITKTHCRVCAACGPLYVTQLGGIYLDLLNVYRAYSEAVSSAVHQSGEMATGHSEVRAMRAAKREILRLIATFVERCAEPEAPPALVATSFVPPLLEPVLGDYSRSIAEARDSEVLTLLATTVDKLHELVAAEVPRILDAVFEPTLRMITRNFEDFPEHRLAFFKLLKAVNTHCFAALFAIPPEHHKLIVDSVVWAFKHTERNVADTGLEILYELLLNVGRAPDSAKQPFYQAFLLALLQDILAVMTDRLHKSGFKMHATLLRHIFHLVEAGQVTAPLYDPSREPHASNQAFLRDHVASLLATSFPNLTRRQVFDFVVGLFDLRMDLVSFKTHLRDFLIQLKEFSVEDNRDLYSEERAAADAARVQREQQARLAVPGKSEARVRLTEAVPQALSTRTIDPWTMSTMNCSPSSPKRTTERTSDRFIDLSIHPQCHPSLRVAGCCVCPRLLSRFLLPHRAGHDMVLMRAFLPLLNDPRSIRSVYAAVASISSFRIARNPHVSHTVQPPRTGRALVLALVNDSRWMMLQIPRRAEHASFPFSAPRPTVFSNLSRIAHYFTATAFRCLAPRLQYRVGD